MRKLGEANKWLRKTAPTIASAALPFQVVLEGVLDEDAGLDGVDSFLVSVLDSLVSLFASFVSLLDSEDDELEPFSLDASLPLRA
jgi:hypothetical protein